MWGPHINVITQGCITVISTFTGVLQLHCIMEWKTYLNSVVVHKIWTPVVLEHKFICLMLKIIFLIRFNS